MPIWELPEWIGIFQIETSSPSHCQSSVTPVTKCSSVVMKPCVVAIKAGGKMPRGEEDSHRSGRAAITAVLPLVARPALTARLGDQWRNTVVLPLP